MTEHPAPDDPDAADPDAADHGPAEAGEPAVERPNRFDRPKEPHDWRWVVGGIGRILITIGLLLFAFVGYQLWGTGIQTAQAQNRLSDQFDERLASIGASGPPTSTTAAPSTAPPTSTDSSTLTTVTATTGVDTSTTTTQPLPMLGRPTLGDPVARLGIASIGMDGLIVIEGVRTSDLQDGPGHFPETPLPGQFGNAAIAGHRTTHGQPFFRINEIEVGDEIVITTLAGRYVYIATGQEIVGPDDYAKVIPTTDPSIATLTLTSCHPRYSTKQRIIIHATIDLLRSDLVTAPFGPLDDGSNGVGVLPDEDGSPDASSETAAPASTTIRPTDSAPTSTTVPVVGPDISNDGQVPGAADGAELFANQWFSDPDAFAPVAWWGLLLSAVALGAYAVSRRARRNLVGALVGIVPFVVVLYFWFENVNRLLPPNL